MSSELKPRMTMLELIQIALREATSDEEVVAWVTRMVNAGTVVLCGNFANCRI